MIWMRDNFSLVLGCLLQFALTENENTAHLITDTPPHFLGPQFQNVIKLFSDFKD